MKMIKKNKLPPSYFKESMPDWKRRKDPVLTRLFYRPVSFICASIISRFDISANTVSYASIIVAISACAFFLLPGYSWHIIGSILVNIWGLMDCVDGNIARSIKKEAYGEFADSLSSYTLVALLCTTMGVAVYHQGGVLFDAGNIWIVIIGAIASTADTLCRLTYQKFKTVSYELYKAGVIPPIEDKRREANQSSSFQAKVENELGVGGILPFVILIATLFHFLDIIVMYCFCFYGGSYLVTSFIYIRKAIQYAKQYPMSTEKEKGNIKKGVN